MAKPLVSVETWQAIKLASISGVSDSRLADKFGVTTGAIQSRRFDDPEWQAAKPKLSSTVGLYRDKQGESQPQAILEVRSDSLAEIGEQNSLLLARYVAGKIKTSAENDLLPEPSNWAELKTASEILRKATGQDRDQPAVSVNLFGGSAGFESSAPTFEAVVETQEGDFC